jgi:SAM-dependent methyltransferase
MRRENTNTHEASVVQMYAKPRFAIWSSMPLRLWPHESQLVSQYCRDKDSFILNAGCGAGRETFAFHDLGFHNVCGIDLTPAFIDMAKQKCRDLSVAVAFYVASVRQLPFPDNHFDVVTMFENIYGHITPRAGRLEALAEVRRVLKPNGMLFLEATSIRSVYRYYVAIRAMELFRYIRNPCHLDRGDKLTCDAKQLRLPAAELPRTHWFRPHEIDEEAEAASLKVVQATTVKGLLADPAASSRSFRGKGRLVYVLTKPRETGTP